MLIAYAKTFAGFLYGFAAHPVDQSGDNRQRGFPLLGKRCGKIPRLHHTYIVFLAVDCRNPLQLLFTESIIETIGLQHSYAESYGVLVTGFYPTLYVSLQFNGMLCKAAWTQSIAGGPVIHVRQKALHLTEAGVIVFYARHDNGVQLVLLIIPVRQCLEEWRRVNCLCQLS